MRINRRGGGLLLLVGVRVGVGVQERKREPSGAISGGRAEL